MIESSITATALEKLSTNYMDNLFQEKVTKTEEDGGSFSALLDSAVQMISGTNTLANQADAAQIDFALGNVSNTHDVSTKQTKALTALQYTVAVKNKVIEAYKEILNMQI